MSREITEIRGGRSAEKRLTKDQIKARIERRIRTIRGKLTDISKALGLNLLMLEHPRYDKFHRERNQQIRNLLGDFKGLSDTDEHRQLFNRMVDELNLRSYCNRE